MPTAAAGNRRRRSRVLRATNPRLFTQRAVFPTVSGRRGARISHRAIRPKTPKKKLRRTPASWTVIRVSMFTVLFSQAGDLTSLGYAA